MCKTLWVSPGSCDLKSQLTECKLPTSSRLQHCGKVSWSQLFMKWPSAVTVLSYTHPSIVRVTYGPAETSTAEQDIRGSLEQPGIIHGRGNPSRRCVPCIWTNGEGCVFWNMQWFTVWLCGCRTVVHLPVKIAGDESSQPSFSTVTLRPRQDIQWEREEEKKGEKGWKGDCCLDTFVEEKWLQ